MKITVDGESLDIAIEAFIVAGYTGRDREQVLHHIHELEEIGVAPPPYVPFYWRFPPWIAMATDNAVVTGTSTSGEAELCLVVDGDDIYVTVGSDHTDRAAETIDIGMSKAVCPKVVGTTAWRAADIGDRWGDLVLRSWLTENGEEVLYQQGNCSALVPPLQLLADLPFARPRRFAMLTGTVPAIGGMRIGQHFRGELHDPLRNQTVGISYDITALEASPANITKGT